MAKGKTKRPVSPPRDRKSLSIKRLTLIAQRWVLLANTPREQKTRVKYVTDYLALVDQLKNHFDI